VTSASSAIAQSFRSVAGALSFLLRHPASWLLAYLVTLALALPLAAALAQSIALADGYPSPLGRGAIAVDAWMRLRHQDGWLVDEFLPRTLGFAAPLDSLSVLMEGPSPQSAAVILATVAFAVVWSGLWAVVLTRMARRRERGWRAAWRAARTLGAPMLLITAVAAAAVLALYVTLRPALIDRVLPLVASERDAGVALVIRGAAYAAFGSLLVLLSVMSDLARAHLVLSGDRSVVRILAMALATLRGAFGSITLICLLILTLHLGWLIGYGVAEVMAGARLGGWRAVAAAQLIVIARVGLRLLWGGSLLALTQHHTRAASR
jgi:hypothetical protein